MGAIIGKQDASISRAIEVSEDFPVRVRIGLGLSHNINEHTWVKPTFSIEASPPEGADLNEWIEDLTDYAEDQFAQCASRMFDYAKGG